METNIDKKKKMQLRLKFKIDSSYPTNNLNHLIFICCIFFISSSLERSLKKLLLTDTCRIFPRLKQIIPDVTSSYSMDKYVQF